MKKELFMEKRVCAAAGLLLILLLAGTGCGGGRTGDGETPPGAEETRRTEMPVKEGVLQYGYFQGEEGISLCSGERFLYSDWEPVEFAYICMDPTCSHLTAGCSARTLSRGGEIENDFSLVYQNRLIIVHAVSELKNDSKPVSEETGTSVMDTHYVFSTEVYEADLDGGNRQRKAVFSGAIDYPNAPNAAILLDGKLYFGGPTEVYNRWETEEEAFSEWRSDAVYCLNLKDYTLETFAVTEEREGTGYQYGLDAYDGMVYVTVSSYSEDCAVWYRIDPAADECEEILRFETDAARFCGAIGNTVYYHYDNDFGNTLYARDLTAGAEEREIMTVEGENMGVIAFVADGKILLQTDRRLEEDDCMTEYAVLDPDGNLLDTVRYEAYVTFADVIGNKILYYEKDSEWWAEWTDSADLAGLTERGVEIGPFVGSWLDTLQN